MYRAPALDGRWAEEIRSYLSQTSVFNSLPVLFYRILRRAFRHVLDRIRPRGVGKNAIDMVLITYSTGKYMGGGA